MGLRASVRRLLGRTATQADDENCIVVENTGSVTETDGGVAVSGYSGPPSRRGQKVVVKNTGSATASGPGSRSVSGIDYT